MTGEGRHRAFTDDARDASPENLRPSFAWSACFLDGGAGVRGEAGGEALQACAERVGREVELAPPAARARRSARV